MILLILLALILGGVGFLYRQAVKYTADGPRELPVVQVSREEYRGLEARWRQLSAGGASSSVVFDADDLNVAIQGSAQPEVRELAGKVFFRIEGERLFVDASLPLDRLPVLSDRYFNGTAELGVGVVDGRVAVNILAARTADGREVPETLLAPVRMALDRVLKTEQRRRSFPASSVEVREGKVILSRPPVPRS